MKLFSCRLPQQHAPCYSLNCCAKECTNTSDIWVLTVLPQDPELRQVWVDKIARDDWTPDENSALCEVIQR